jgi:hypothetical protein
VINFRTLKYAKYFRRFVARLASSGPMDQSRGHVEAVRRLQIHYDVTQLSWQKSAVTMERTVTLFVNRGVGQHDVA